MSEKIIFCQNCGQKVKDGDPTVYESSNFLSETPDMEDIYQLIRMRDKSNKNLRSEISFLEEGRYTKGRYYRKLCHTLQFGRSFIISLIYFTPEYKEACENWGEEFNTSTEDKISSNVGSISNLGSLVSLSDKIFEGVRKKICGEEEEEK